VATAAEIRLNIWRNQRASLAAESIERQPIRCYTCACVVRLYWLCRIYCFAL
jgi:hypothetical protein